MVAERALPMKPEVSARALVEDIAETVAPHGYKVTQHTVRHDHERGETVFSVKFVRANPDQGVLGMNGDGGN